MSTQAPGNDDEALDQQVFTALAAAMAPTELPPVDRARLRARVLRSIAPAPAGTTTWSVGGEGWVQSGPLAQMKLLRRDEVAGTQELLIRFFPGLRVPEHSHHKEEQMIVLEGECHVGDHLLRQGDVHVASPGSWHPAITTERGTVVLLRCEYPLPVA